MYLEYSILEYIKR